MKKLLSFIKKYKLQYSIAFLNKDYKLNLTFSWKNSRSTASHTTVLYHKQVCEVGTTNVWTGPFTAVLVYLINHQRHRAHASLWSKLKTNNTLIRSDRGRKVVFTTLLFSPGVLKHYSFKETPISTNYYIGVLLTWVKNRLFHFYNVYYGVS